MCRLRSSAQLSDQMLGVGARAMGHCRLRSTPVLAVAPLSDIGLTAIIGMFISKHAHMFDSRLQLEACPVQARNNTLARWGSSTITVLLLSVCRLSYVCTPMICCTSAEEEQDTEEASE